MPRTAGQQKKKVTPTSVKRNDTVEVIAGKDAGKRGKILQVIPEKNRVIVQGAGLIKRHTKPNPARGIKGGIAEREAAIHASNVMLVCGECGKRTRVGHKRLDDGKRIRVCRKCTGSLDK
jgi:large subunit ribosomal protein L24